MAADSGNEGGELPMYEPEPPQFAPIPPYLPPFVPTALGVRIAAARANVWTAL
jgi:hypothetical protein